MSQLCYCVLCEGPLFMNCFRVGVLISLDFKNIMNRTTRTRGTWSLYQHFYSETLYEYGPRSTTFRLSKRQRSRGKKVTPHKAVGTSGQHQTSPERKRLVYISLCFVETTPLGSIFIFKGLELLCFCHYLLMSSFFGAKCPKYTIVLLRFFLFMVLSLK